MLIDGKALAEDIYAQIKKDVTVAVSEKKQRPPSLVVILVGDNPASQTYVATKDRTATQKCGFRSLSRVLPADISQAALNAVVEEYAKDSEVDGILLQLPLPKGLDKDSAIALIPADKDVDGLQALNQGKLMLGTSGLRPCTPSGVLKLIDVAHSDGKLLARAPEVDLSGKKTVVVGRSILVGKPLAMMLLERNATVTIVHSKTKNPAEIASQADILIAAVGVPELIDETWIKEGAIVIDVGINRLADKRLVGDVAFSKVLDKCSAITPVPGGVGPMTVAMLMKNTWEAYIRHHS